MSELNAEEWQAKVEATMPRRKVPVSIRMDPDLLAQLRATGAGWQTRVNAILRVYVESAAHREVER